MNGWNVMEVFDQTHFEEALKWEDDFAPMECPGCLGAIDGWTAYAAHQVAPGPGLEVGFIKYEEMSRVTRPLTVCTWDTARLSARVHYHAYVDKWRKHALWGQNHPSTDPMNSRTATIDRVSTSGTTVFGSTEPRPLGGVSGSSATPGS